MSTMVVPSKHVIIYFFEYMQPLIVTLLQSLCSKYASTFQELGKHNKEEVLDL